MRRHVSSPEGDDWNDQMHIMRVFDPLILNTDCNTGNLLITKGWKIWMIDHSRAFRIQTEVRTPKNLVQCDRDFLAAMKRRDQIVAFFSKAPKTAIYASERRR